MDINELFQISIEKKASDLHILPDAPPILRIDGELSSIENYSVLDAKTTQQLIHSTMNEEQKKIYAAKLEIDFTILMRDSPAGFRANAFHQADGAAAVFRVIPRGIPTIETVGAPEVLKNLLELSSGLILLTGPTGCGKSTTLAAMINHVNATRASHIITIEDPIEFKHTRIKSIINQRQVKRDTLSFSAALRSALREDPDILLVGEMRDLETIRLTLTAAETGHLVLATLHTGSVAHAISRIIDVFPSGEKNIIKNMLSHSIQAVICQTLIKRKGGGRVAAHEIMLGTPAIHNLIRENKLEQMYSVIQTSGKIGMQTMEQSLQELIQKNIISVDEI